MGRDVSFDRIIREGWEEKAGAFTLSAEDQIIEWLAEQQQEEAEQEREEAREHETQKKARQIVLRQLAQAWNERNKKMRPSFYQLCAILLELAGWEDAHIAQFLCTLSGSADSVRKMRCVGRKKLKRLAAHS